MLTIVLFSSIFAFKHQQSSATIIPSNIVPLETTAESQFILKEIGQFNDRGQAWGVTISGSYAYVADTSDGLEILNISDLYNPIKVGKSGDLGIIESVIVSNSYAFVNSYTNGLKIFSIKFY